MCKMIISLGVFFNFQILIFQVVRGTERAKNDPKWQKRFLSVPPYISGTIYHMIFIYGTHACIKGLCLQAFFTFFFFKILILRIIRVEVGGKRAKNGPEWQKILSVSLCISWTVHHMIVILVHMCKTIIFPANFFIFSIFIFGVFTPCKRAKNDLKLPTSLSH